MEQLKQEQGLTLAQILKMFKGKVVLIICLSLVAAILGGAFAVVSSVFSRDYGTSVEFYVSTADSSHTLLSVLQSEAFAEKLLLEDNGLPAKEQCDPADYAAALAAIEATKAARDAKYEAKKALDLIPYKLAPIQQHYDYLNSLYTEARNLLDIYKGANTSDKDILGENHAQKIAEYEAAVAKAAADQESYYTETYFPMIEKKLAAEYDLKSATDALDEALRAEEELVEKVLASWRTQASVQKKLSDIYDGVRFSYALREVRNGNNVSLVENPNFIVATVLVQNDEDFANELLAKIKSISPEIIENNIEQLTGEVDVNCTLMSTFSTVEVVNGGGMIKDAIVYALVAAIAAFALICIVIIGKNLIKMIFASDDDAEIAEEAKEEEYTNV